MNITEYLNAVKKVFQSGKATEHSYRPSLISLMESFGNISAINEPAKGKVGAPDCVISKEGIPIGYIEAKNIGDPDLAGKKKNREQFDRYKEGLNNIIFTDYLTFDHYHYGKCVNQISIANYDDKAAKISYLPDNFAAFESMMKDFCSTFGQTITNPKELAKMMAGKARLLADVIERALLGDKESHDNSSLQDQLLAFQKILIHDITPKQFADMYAQTVTYGMFAARLNDTSIDSFSRQEAAELIPKSNPFLRRLFSYISGSYIDDRIKWIVDDLANVFLASNVREILSKYGQSTQTEDPIIHFYETFLSEYDPKLRKSRGVWYTPKPVVRFIVQAVDEVLKSEFALADGLADTSKTTVEIDGHDKKRKQKEEVHRVQILDPAVGTGAFLTEVVAFIHDHFFKSQAGAWTGYVKAHLLPRLNGFELLMASYAMAHLQLDQYLVNTGYQTGEKGERLRVFLTNSLEEAHPDTGTLFATWLSEEANEANYIKRDTPVMCVLGNPPYSGISSNNGDWIKNLINDYQYVDGKHFNERKHWLNDDYVKFIRYGQYFIEKNGSGVLAYINPHGYLDNPTFRGMRWHLLKTYDKIYTIDLHGNAKKKEVAPDGSKDENVFDIQQGVSINIFIKTGKKKPKELAKVFHYDLYGRREDKYHFLQVNSLNTIKFNSVNYSKPYYFFVNKDDTGKSKYDKGFRVNELFTNNVTGIVTMGDSFIIDADKNNLIDKIKDFINNEYTEFSLTKKYNLGKNYSKWIVGNKEYIKSLNLKPTKISYRPFDIRYTIYDNKLVWRWRDNTMQHFLKGENIGLVFKLGNAEVNSASVMVSKNIIDFRSWSRPGMQGGDYIAPLYIYPEDNSRGDIDPNLNQGIIADMGKSLGLRYNPDPPELFASGEEDTFTPIDVFDYIYAVIHSPSYRTTYQEFLKIDFPRIPYPVGGAKNQKTFRELVKLGGELRRVHLLESISMNDFITSYPKDGENTVEKPEHKAGRVYINTTQYFEGVPEIVWNFYIGGYQPAQKWLKNRKGISLTYDDITHYQEIIVALARTHELMGKIDKYKFW